MRTKSVISAVHDDDLIGFLEGLGVLSDVRSGGVRCKFCREIISLDNLVAVFPESGDIKFVCDKPGCLAFLAEHRSELREQTPERREVEPHDGITRAKGNGGYV